MRYFSLVFVVLISTSLASAESFNVMTYNTLAHWLEDVSHICCTNVGWNDPTRPRKERVRAIIEQEDADLIGFQEVTELQLPDLIDFLPGYDYVLGRPNSFYNAIFYRSSRFLLQDSGIFELSRDPNDPFSAFHHVVWADLPWLVVLVAKQVDGAFT